VFYFAEDVASLISTNKNEAIGRQLERIMTGNTNGKIRVLLVDDHRLLRECITAILANVEGLEIVGSLQSGEEAVAQVPAIQPDVILMDILMNGMTGIEATRWIKEQNKSIKIILISAQMNKELVEAGVQSGIDGYLPKDVSETVLVEAIRAVAGGERVFGEAITLLVFEDFFKKKRATSLSGQVTLSDELTRREQEVLAALASGKTGREIADELFISIKTVETHRSHILDKLGLRNNAELARYAIKNKLISLD
jgi:DNA-binding NarL/FixJ family response regulator